MPLDSAAPVPVRDPVAECRQPYPLPPDVRYVIDGILGEQGIDDGSYIALNLFVPRKPILDAIDNHDVDAGRLTWRRRHALGLRLMDLVGTTLPGLPLEVRNGIAFSSLQWLRRDLEGLARVFAAWAFEDEITGGAMKPWLPRWRRRIRSNGEVGKRTMRRLGSPAFIARVVKGHHESRERREMGSRILDRVERATVLTDCLGSYAAEMAAQRERAYIESIRQFVETGGTADKEQPAARRRRIRHRRAVIRRSLRAASAVLPASQIRAFARAESVRIAGCTLDLAVRPQAPLAERGHGVLDVTAMAHDGTERLASLCIYHDRTPALDQLAALALAMGAGEEADIVHDANIVQMFPAGREHPLLAARETRDISARTADPANWTTIDRSYWSFDERRAREQAYWEATKHIWIERLAVFACGRRVTMLGTQGEVP